MKMQALALGQCCCPYETIAPGVDDGIHIHLPVSSYLVTLDDGKHLLIDTGMDDGHIDDPDLTWGGMPQARTLQPVMRPEDSIVARLASVGLTPDDIDYVVNTHLHFDHAGNNSLFTNATFYAQRDHYEFALDNPHFPNQYWNLPGLTYELLDGETQIVGGLTIVPSPGHAPGHQSVVVPLPETGPVIITGDAVNTQENYDTDRWDFHRDPEAARASGLALRDLAEKLGARMFYSHDRNQAKSTRWAPEGFYN